MTEDKKAEHAPDANQNCVTTAEYATSIARNASGGLVIETIELANTALLSLSATDIAAADFTGIDTVSCGLTTAGVSGSYPRDIFVGTSSASNLPKIYTADELLNRAKALAEDATRSGLRVQISLVPKLPLAMGQHEMVCEVRNRDYRTNQK